MLGGFISSVVPQKKAALCFLHIHLLTEAHTCCLGFPGNAEEELRLRWNYARRKSDVSRNCWVFPLNGEMWPHCSTPETSPQTGGALNSLQCPLVVKPRYYMLSAANQFHSFPWIVQACIPSYRSVSCYLINKRALVYSLTFKSTLDTVCTWGKEWTGAQEAVKGIWGCTDSKSSAAVQRLSTENTG